MNTIRAFTLPHVGENHRSSNDRFFFNTEPGKTYFCISDGAGSSFNPTLWAELITQQEVVDSRTSFNEQDIETIQKEWNKKVKEKIDSKLFSNKIETLYISGKEAGATFVRMCFCNEKKTWKATTMGDSVMLFIPYKQTLPQYVVSTNQDNANNFEYTKADYIFDTMPDGLLSRSKCNLSKQRETKAIKIEKGTFVFMTDALAAWVLENHNFTANRLQKLLNISSHEEFIQFVSTIRDEIDVTDPQSSVSRKMGNNAEIGNDDTTLMIVTIEDKKNLQFSDNNICQTHIEELIDKEIDTEILQINSKLEKNNEQLNVYKGQKATLEQKAREILNSEKFNLANVSDLYANLEALKKQYIALDNITPLSKLRETYRLQLAANTTNPSIENDEKLWLSYFNSAKNNRDNENTIFNNIKRSENECLKYFDEVDLKGFINNNPDILGNLLGIINELKLVKPHSQLESENEKLITKIKCLEFQKYNKKKVVTPASTEKKKFFRKLIEKITILIKKYFKR